MAACEGRPDDAVAVDVHAPRREALDRRPRAVERRLAHFWPPPLVQSVWLASSANIRWCVLKHVPMCVSFFVVGSYTARCRPALAIGNSLAEGWLDPSLHTSGLSGGRTAEVIQTRPL